MESALYSTNCAKTNRLEIHTTFTKQNITSIRPVQVTLVMNFIAKQASVSLCKETSGETFVNIYVVYLPCI